VLTCGWDPTAENGRSTELQRSRSNTCTDR